MNEPEKPETARERRSRAREERQRPQVVQIPAEVEVDPFAEFHDGWEPVRKRRSEFPRD